MTRSRPGPGGERDTVPHATLLTQDTKNPVLPRADDGLPLEGSSSSPHALRIFWANLAGVVVLGASP
jgi:hypothetical protein